MGLESTNSRTLGTEIKIIIFTVLVFIISPLLGTFFMLAYIYRCLLELFVKLFKPEYGKIVTLKSTMLSTDLPKENSRNCLVVPVVFQGSIDLKKLRQSILNKVNEKDNQMSLRYPELQQMLSIVGGYQFWKWDKYFDIRNHVFLGYDGKLSMDRNTLNILTAEMLRKPFEEVRSPWEVYLFPEYRHKKTVETRCIILIRFNHCLVDGLSIMQMISNAAKQPISNNKLNLTNREVIRKMGFRVYHLICLPYAFVTSLYTNYDKKLFDEQKRNDNSNLVVKFCDPLPASLIRDIKDRLGVTFSGVQLAAYTGGLRKLLMENHKSVPESMHVVIPVPVHGHRDKLRNSMKYGIITLPVGTPDSTARLKFIENQLSFQRVSGLPSQLYYSFLLAGLLPIFLFRLVRKYSFNQSGLISNLPVPMNNLSYDGHAVENFTFAAGVNAGHVWFGITSLTYGDQIEIQSNYIESTGMDGSKNSFCEGVLEELQILKMLQSMPNLTNTPYSCV